MLVAAPAPVILPEGRGGQVPSRKPSVAAFAFAPGHLVASEHGAHCVHWWGALRWSAHFPFSASAARLGKRLLVPHELDHVCLRLSCSDYCCLVLRVQDYGQVVGH